MNEIVVPVISGLFLLGGALLAYLGTRGKTQTDSKVALDARLDGRLTREIERLDSRIDAQNEEIGRLESELKAESRIRTAATRIVRSLMAQWPGSPWPHLSATDVADLGEDPTPAHWKG